MYQLSPPCSVRVSSVTVADLQMLFQVSWLTGGFVSYCSALLSHRGFATIPCSIGYSLIVPALHQILSVRQQQERLSCPAPSHSAACLLACNSADCVLHCWRFTCVCTCVRQLLSVMLYSTNPTADVVVVLSDLVSLPISHQTNSLSFFHLSSPSITPRAFPFFFFSLFCFSPLIPFLLVWCVLFCSTSFFFFESPFFYPSTSLFFCQSFSPRLTFFPHLLPSSPPPVSPPAALPADNRTVAALDYNTSCVHLSAWVVVLQ